VLATNVTTGKTSPQTVTAVMVKRGPLDADNRLVFAAEDAGTASGDEVPAFSQSAYGRVSSEVRGQVLENNPTCVYCGENPADQVDHINSLKQDWESCGWPDEQAVRTATVNDAGNLTGSFASCNGAKGESSSSFLRPFTATSTPVRSS
jgi:hypothetical protein